MFTADVVCATLPGPAGPARVMVAVLPVMVTVTFGFDELPKYGGTPPVIETEPLWPQPSVTVLLSLIHI